jgi:hypothetical protein
MLSLLLIALVTSAQPERRAPRPPSPSAAPPVSVAPERPADEVAAEVNALLGAIDTPISAARWRALGEQARPGLEAVAGDPRQLPSRRAKAVDALAALGSERDAPRFLALALDEGEPLVLRLSAVRGVGATTPTAKLASSLLPALEGRGDSRIRAAAARVLATRAPAECDGLRDRVLAEDATVRGQFEPVARACAWTEQTPR